MHAACISKPEKIHKTTNFSDIDRSLNEIRLPNIVSALDEKQIRILKDVSEFSPTSITDIAQRLSLSESTISRQVARLADIQALEVLPKGKTKELRITLTGKLLL